MQKIEFLITLQDHFSGTIKTRSIVNIYNFIHISIIEDEMSAEGMGNFYSDIGVNMRNCEPMLTAYIL